MFLWVINRIWLALQSQIHIPISLTNHREVGSWEQLMELCCHRLANWSYGALVPGCLLFCCYWTIELWFSTELWLTLPGNSIHAVFVVNYFSELSFWGGFCFCFLFLLAHKELGFVVELFQTVSVISLPRDLPFSALTCELSFHFDGMCVATPFPSIPVLLPRPQAYTLRQPTSTLTPTCVHTHKPRELGSAYERKHPLFVFLSLSPQTRKSKYSLII